MLAILVNRLIVFQIILSLISSAAYANEKSENEVNYFDLMANLNSYSNKEVLVAGVLGCSFGEKGYLFFSKEQHENHVTGNAIKVSFPKDFKCGDEDGKYFYLSGKIKGDTVKYIDEVANIFWMGKYIWPISE